MDMLVLERYEGESIMIRDDIEITVINASRGASLINVVAPLSVPLLRDELAVEGWADAHPCDDRTGSGSLRIRRRESESLLIGDQIRLMIVESHRGKVKIGVAAPRDLEVHRLETWMAKKNESRDGALVASGTSV